MKKIICILLAFLMLVGCGPTETEQEVEQPKEPLKAGTYEGKGNGFHGDVIVDVTLDEEKIVSIDIKESKETRFISDDAMNKLPQDMVDNQAVYVDTYTGCTLSSLAVMNAVKDALTKADAFERFDKKVATKSTEVENVETDVVVVGGGIAGLSAAITAKEAGVDVTVVEKLDRVGGSTVMSGGILYATGSIINKDLDNDTEALAEYWQMRAEGNSDPAMLKLAAEESANTVQKLSDWGVMFSTQIKGAGTSPAKRALYATNANVDGAATDGVDFIVPLYNHAKELGINIITGARATELIQEGDRVIGVKATKGENEFTVKGSSVIIATGGFDMNREMMKEHSPEMAGEISLSSIGNTGDGVKMAEALGAKTLYHGGVIGFKIIDPLHYYLEGPNLIEWMGQLGVTDQGVRFGKENADYPIACTQFINGKKNGAKKFYYILDSTAENVAGLGELAVAQNLGVKADSLEELANAAGIDAAALAETVKTYNAHAEAGEPDEFGKENLVAVSKAPFYAVEVKPATLGTMGGLVLNENAQVLDTNDQPINGLYAAGEVANGQILYKEYPASGTSICVSTTFGRIAGQQAANEAK